jgi:hypothetical protein
MRSPSVCPICKNITQLVAHGVVAPWITELCDKLNPGHTQLHFCPECDFHYFAHRYNEIEVEKIYSEYRSDSFFKIRRRWEPWYNKRVNEAFSDPVNNSDQIQSRRKFTENALLAAGIDTATLRGCIDFGGDHGQFVPTEVSKPHFIVEKNSSKKGIGSEVFFVDDINDVHIQVDLVTNCYVLEHMSDLDSVIESMRSKNSAQGCILIEVPLDGFKTSKFHRTQFYKSYLGAIIRFRLLFVAVDFVSGVFRQFFGRIPWFGIVKQSEHVNYFSVESLERFLTLHDSTILYTSAPDVKYKVGNIRQGRLASIIK